MRFDVIYGYASFARNQGFIGKGSVLLTDNALVFSGEIPRFSTVIFLHILRFATVSPTIRTVPYSKITRHVEFFEHQHRITYLRPDGQWITIAFKIKNRNERKVFKSRFSEHRTAIQTLYTRN